MTILVVGDANADINAAIERFPAEGDDSLVTALAWSSGGSAANVAAALGRLGLPVRLLARVGSDPAATVALRAARAAGADLSAIQIDPLRATGLCYAAVSPDGNRTFFSFRGANAAMAQPPAGLLAGLGWLHISAYALIEGTQRASCLALIDMARARALPISLDLCMPALRAGRSEIVALLPQLAVLFGNELELAELCPGLSQDGAAGQLLRHGVPLAVIKLGPRGCLVAEPAGLQHVPAFTVAALDTSGCGDAFVAGFLLARLSGAPLAQCATLANALGALTATRPGAADALPTRDELRALLLARPGATAAAALLSDHPAN